MGPTDAVQVQGGTLVDTFRFHDGERQVSKWRDRVAYATGSVPAGALAPSAAIDLR